MCQANLQQVGGHVHSGCEASGINVQKVHPPCRKLKMLSTEMSGSADMAASPCAAASAACCSVPCSLRRLDHRNDCSVTCSRHQVLLRCMPVGLDHPTTGLPAPLSKVGGDHSAAAVTSQLHGCPTLARSVSMCRRSMCSDRSPASICLSCCSCSAVKEPRQQWAEVGHRMRS